MASAQVLRKQELLTAGKLRLKEFREQRAAKKAASTVPPSKSNVLSNERQPIKAENVRSSDLDGAGTSDGLIRDVSKTSAAVNYSDSKETSYSHKTDLNNTHQDSLILTDGLSSSLAGLVQNVNNLEIHRSSLPKTSMPLDVGHFQESEEEHNDRGAYTGYKEGHTYDNISYQYPVVNSHVSQELDGSSSHSSLHGIDESKSKDNFGSVEVSSTIHDSSFLSEPLPQNYSTLRLQNEHIKSNMPVNDLPSNSLYGGSVQTMTNTSDSSCDVGKNMINNHSVYDSGESELNDPVSNMHGRYSDGGKPSWSASYSSDATTPSNYVPSYTAATESNLRSTQPSFLDSFSVSKSSSGPQFQCNGPESFTCTSSRSHNENIVESDGFDKPSVGSNTQEYLSKDENSIHTGSERLSKPVTSSENGHDLTGLKLTQISFDMKPEFLMPKENEDFYALEQHIEDLTQEKFSLQRALESSRTLAESLTAENFSLTDSYNQQRSVIEQLKSDMEQLQEEIKAQLAELESIKMEYANVQLECNAADERAKLLASEVISLEEKALKLRSSELKLEHELEKSQAEVLSYKKKLSSLEKDRQDLQSTIAALQEEKTLLQSKLCKVSVAGKSFDLIKSSIMKKDMSTSTEDLDDTADSFDPVHTEHSISSVFLPPETEQSNFPASIARIPSDHMRMIQNINSLISELALEKEELMNALASESSMNSKFKDLNKELSRKLEVQTHRVELLTSQSMASHNIQTRLLEERPVPDLTAYADEGDEVVERVLGWIMKLFPGGPSRRRTSKLI